MTQIYLDSMLLKPALYYNLCATVPDFQIKTVLSFLQAHSRTLLEFLTSVLQSTYFYARRLVDYPTATAAAMSFSIYFARITVRVTTELRKELMGEVFPGCCEVRQ